MSNDISFIHRLTSAENIGAVEKGDLTEVVPEQINKSSAYKSPYKLHFNFKWSDLVARFEQPPHSLVEKEANPQPWQDFDLEPAFFADCPRYQ